MYTAQQSAFHAQQTALFGHSTGQHRGRGKSWSSRGRGFSQATQVARQTPQPSGPSGPKPFPAQTTRAERDPNRIPTCQICGKQGHTAIKCWHRFDHALQPDDIPQALAALTLENNIHDTEWTADTGASAHMTGNSGMLSNLRQYLGHDAVLIGDGSLHTITHIGDTIIQSGHSFIKLKDVLLVPDLAKNLLSISQLTSDYPYNCDFSGVGFSIKERATNRTLLTGRRKGNLCVVPTP
ncbi:hypothetical protein I3843_08G077300 [Carya illinoinensis]|nr:hypothetical protein I3843_08G077300 [Carya illinoinensis]